MDVLSRSLTDKSHTLDVRARDCNEHSSYRRSDVGVMANGHSSHRRSGSCGHGHSSHRRWDSCGHGHSSNRRPDSCGQRTQF